jgi:hypothetical protein
VYATFILADSNLSLMAGDFSKPESREAIRAKTILNDVSCTCASGEVLAM